MINKKVVYIFLYLAMQGVFATQQVRYTSMEASGGPTTGEEVDFNIDSPGDSIGSSASDPLIVYVPFNDTLANTQKFVTFSSSNIVGEVSGDTVGKIQLSLTISADDSTDEVVYFLEDSSTTYYYIGKSSPTLSSSSDTSIDFEIDLNTICDHSKVTTPCSTLQTITGDDQELDINVYISTETDEDYQTENDSIDPSSLTTGVFLQLKFMAMKTPDPAVVITNLAPGDEQLIVSYSITSDFGNDVARNLAVINPSPTVSSGIVGFNDLTSYETLFDLEQTDDEATVKIKNLVNGTSYDISILTENKHQIGSFLSLSSSESPQDIEEVFDGSSCFFLTAGFGYMHPVVNLFRSFRDMFLLKTTIGKYLVFTYYKVARPLAPFVYKDPILAPLFRALAYIWLWGGFFLLIMVFGLVIYSSRFFYKQLIS